MKSFYDTDTSASAIASTSANNLLIDGPRKPLQQLDSKYRNNRESESNRTGAGTRWRTYQYEPPKKSRNTSTANANANASANHAKPNLNHHDLHQSHSYSHSHSHSHSLSQYDYQFQNQMKMHSKISNHSTKPSYSTGVTSVATSAYGGSASASASASISVSDSRDDDMNMNMNMNMNNLYVSKISNSGKKEAMRRHSNSELSFDLDSNLNSNSGHWHGHGHRGNRGYYESQASQSTMFQDAMSNYSNTRTRTDTGGGGGGGAIYECEHYSPSKYSAAAGDRDRDRNRDQHYRYYSDASASQYANDASFIPGHEEMTHRNSHGYRTYNSGFGPSPTYSYNHKYGHDAQGQERGYNRMQLSTPQKYAHHVTLLQDPKPFWSRLKSIFDGADANSSCIDKGLFCNCMEGAVSSPPTPERPHLPVYYDGRQYHDPCPDHDHDSSYGYQGTYHYHSFKDLGHLRDEYRSKSTSASACVSNSGENANTNTNTNANAKTVKKRNSDKLTDECDEDVEQLANDYSLINLGTTPADTDANFHGDFHSPPDFDFSEHNLNWDADVSPPADMGVDMVMDQKEREEEEGKRRLFQTPAKEWKANGDCPDSDSILAEESPTSNWNFGLTYSASDMTTDLDSYAGDVDNRSTCISVDVETLGNESVNDRSHMKTNDWDANAIMPSRCTISRPQLSPMKSKKKKVDSVRPGNLMRPPLPSIGRQMSLGRNTNNSPTISPMNTVGTTGTLHRRIRSTFSAHSLVQIFDESGQDFLSPRQRKEPAVIPKTVKTVKKNRNGQNPCDDISPLDDDECRATFRSRMEKVDIAIDDDSLCSPIHGNSNRSFNFSHNMTSVELFGKENIEKDEEQETYKIDESPLTLGRTKISKRCISYCAPIKDPEGTYLPICDQFHSEGDHNQADIAFQGWVAYSKETKKRNEFLDGLRNKDKIKRKHLRYIIIEKDFMYVYSSKKQLKDGEDDSNSSASTGPEKGVKKLKLSKEMIVEIEDISRRHGQCIVLRDLRLQNIRDSDVVCTMLPVQLTPDFFEDESYSQLIDSKGFDEKRHELFASQPTPDSVKHDRSHGILQDINCLTSSGKSPHPDSSKKQRNTKREWPITASEFVSIEQNVATIHFQFALDAAKWYKPPKY